MNKYSITGRKSGNTLEVDYDERGILNNIYFRSEVNEELVDKVLRNVPRREYDVIGWMPEQFDINLIPSEVKFEVFWEVYDLKVGRIAAEKEWSKLIMAERTRAIVMAPRYHQWRKNLAPPIAAVHPERYLKHKRFNDDLTLK